MYPDTKELVTSLTSIMSISGQEERGRETLCSILQPYFDEYIPDPSGTHVFVRRCGKQGAPKLLLDAHFDEIGMRVRDITEEGFLRVVSIGGLDRRILPAAEVLIYGKETLYGVIGAVPPHLQKAEDYKQAPKIEELLIDTGYDRETLRTLVDIGTPVGFYEKTAFLLGSRICGRSMDNKACCAAAVLGAAMAKRENMAWDLYVTLSAREEAGMASGCSAAAYRIRPDAAIVTDVTFASAPGVGEDESGKMGSGPVLSLSAVTDRRLTEWLLQLCRQRGIPCQTCVDACDTGTNATMLSLVGAGIPTAVVSVPITSMHTYNETVDTVDIEHAAALYAAATQEGGLLL